MTAVAVDLPSSTPSWEYLLGPQGLILLLVLVHTVCVVVAAVRGRRRVPPR